MNSLAFRSISLAQACRLITDGSHFSPTPRDDGYPIVNAKDIPSGRVQLETCTRISEREYLLLKSQNCAPNVGDVLLSKDGTIGRVVYYKEDLKVVLLSSVAILRPNHDLDPAFLAQALRSHLFDQQLFRLQSGSALKRLVLGDIRKIHVPAPSVPVQAKIAEILSTLDETIEQTEALIAKYQQIKAGLMHDLFTRGVTPDGRLRPPRNKAPQLYKESPLGWIPNEWEIKPLASFANPAAGSFVNGPFGSDLLTKELTESGVPVVYVQDIHEDEYRKVSSGYVTENKANELLVCNVRNGDVLVAKVGDPPGIAAVYSKAQRAVITQDVIRIRPSDNVVPQFLASLLNSSVGTTSIRNIIIEGTRARVSLTEFKRLMLPKPPRIEQGLIADRVLSSQKSLSADNAAVAKSKLEKAGLMHDLLTGRVRVRVREAIAA
jgi:type I restriction enzyme, S subunit